MLVHISCYVFGDGLVILEAMLLDASFGIGWQLDFLSPIRILDWCWCSVDFFLKDLCSVLPWCWHGLTLRIRGKRQGLVIPVPLGDGEALNIWIDLRGTGAWFLFLTLSLLCSFGLAAELLTADSFSYSFYFLFCWYGIRKRGRFILFSGGRVWSSSVFWHSNGI